MNRRYTLLIFYILLFLVEPLWAQSVLKKGIRALIRGDYAQVETAIQRSSKRHLHHPLRYWLWALYRSIDSLPNHNYEEAHFVLNRAIDSWQAAKARDQKRWLKIARLPSLDSLLGYRDYLDYRLLLQAKASGELQAIEHYLKEHEHSPYKVEALSWRDSLAFAQAEAAGTYDAYEEFIARYPGAPQVALARQRRDMLLFEEWTREGRLSDYLDFLARFPNSHARDEAERRVFYLSTATFRLEDFVHFLERFPHSSMRQHALDMAAYLSMLAGDWSLLTPYAQEPEVQRWKEYAHLRNRPLFPYLKNGLWGLVAAGGELLISPHLEGLWEAYGCAPITDDFIVVQDSQGKLGIYDRQGRKIFSPLFEKLEWLKDGLAWVATAAGEGLVHITGLWLIDATYDRLEPFVNHTFLAEKQGRWGVLDVYGRVLIPLDYDKIELWNTEKLIVLYKSTATELMPVELLTSLQQGEPYYPLAVFDAVELLDDRFLKVKSGDYYGVLSATLEVVLEVAYKNIQLKKNTWIVHTDEGMRLLRMSGRPLVADTFALVQPGSRYILARRDSLWHIYDYLGQRIERQVADTAWFLGSAVVLQTGKKTTALLENGRWQDWSDYHDFQLLRTTHDASRYFIQMRNRRDRIGVIDRYGQERLPFRYEAVYMLDNYLIKVHAKHRVGLVDTSGREILPLDYEGIGDLIEGTIPLMKRGRFGVFVPHKTLIEPQFESLLHAEGRYWRARVGGKWGLLDEQGNKLLPFRYDAIRLINDTLILTKQDLQWQLVQPLSRQIYWEGNRVEVFHCASSCLLLLHQGEILKIWKDGEWLSWAAEYVSPHCVQGQWLFRLEQVASESPQQWIVAWKDAAGNTLFEQYMKEDELLEWDCD